MIKEKNAKKYCCEDISLIENYNKAVNSIETWHCHHRKEIELNKKAQELININLYYNRPADELIFLTKSEHMKLHSINRQYSDETRRKMGESRKGNKNGMYKNNRYIGINNPMYGVHRFGKDAPNYGNKQPKYKWETPSGEIIIMDMANVHRWHPDWIKIGEV